MSQQNHAQARCASLKSELKIENSIENNNPIYPILFSNCRYSNWWNCLFD